MCVLLAYRDADAVIGAASSTNTPMERSLDGIYMNKTRQSDIIVFLRPHNPTNCKQLRMDPSAQQANAISACGFVCVSTRW